ncbi:hypothetical protein AX15_006456 [Amanita polypyramis BW_CC]|nr:hypothetical protein AX15_006456 [Amanita polypyramis BW_CC]
MEQDFSYLSTCNIRDIAHYGPPTLWEALQEQGSISEYEKMSELCTHAFPNFILLSAKNAEMAAEQQAKTQLQRYRHTPPSNALLEPVTLKAPRTLATTTTAASPDAENSMMDMDLFITQSDFNTIACQEALLKKAQILINQLTWIHQQATDLQGDGSAHITHAITETFHLKGKATTHFEAPPPTTHASSMPPICPQSPAHNPPPTRGSGPLRKNRSHTPTIPQNILCCQGS